MESVLNDQYLKTYSKHFSDIVTGNFFENKSEISGEEILHFTRMKQINLLIVKKLMDQWIAEADKLKSPFFNYENPEVTKALNDLMNVLSRKILVDKRNFAPLVQKAVIDTLYLIFSPYEFFHNELAGTSRNHTKKDLLDSERFIKINSELYSAFLNKIRSEDRDTFSSDETRKIFNKVCEEINFDPEDPDPYIDIFTEIEPIYLQKIYKEYPSDDSSDQQNTREDEAGYEDDDKKQETLQEQYEKPQNTVADDLAANPSKTVLDYHQKQKIDSIRKNISIHQKFMFVKELFQNDENEFFQVIEFLDGCRERDDALEYLDNNYFNPGIWNDEDEAVIEFMTVIDKKFI